MASPDKDALAGIRLILEEIRDLRREGAEDRRRADEDRKRADEDRKRADRRFEQIVAESREREKGLHQALIVIGNVGRTIIRNQEEHTRLLKQILRQLRTSGNGRHSRGNGS
jgi:hypothetical protein